MVASARIGPRGHLGDHVLVREGSVVGEDGMLRARSIDGPRQRHRRAHALQNDVIVGPATVIEEDVLVSPRVTFLSDPTMGRRVVEPGSPGILVRRASRIGTGAILFPPLEMGRRRWWEPPRWSAPTCRHAPWWPEPPLATSAPSAEDEQLVAG